VREMGTEDADRAVENVTRKQLSRSHQAVPVPAASALAATTLGYRPLQNPRQDAFVSHCGART
jgi:hypothetical protein